MLNAFATGFATGAGLIIAIGAQNAYILRMGLLKSHIFSLCLICALSDAVLIAAGVLGLGALVESSPAVLNIMRYFGAVFLFSYGLVALHRMIKPNILISNMNKATTHRTAVVTALALTFLNPHVYLDTLVLMGALSTTFDNNNCWFGLGGICASFVWFFSLGYGAAFLQPIFSKPVSWRVLDGFIAIVMISIAVSLLLSG